MSTSFLDHERNETDVSFYTAAGDSPQNLTMSDERNSVIEVKPTNIDPDNVLLAAGDGNKIINNTDNPDTSQDLIHSESNSPGLNTSSKRKREPSTDRENEQDDEHINSNEECDNISDTELSEKSTVIAALDDKTEETDDLADFDKNLPDTVTLLTTESGAKVYLVGTAHFSIESQEDVGKVIQMVKPHVVLVELCKARINILQYDEKMILAAAKSISFGMVRDLIRETGVLHGVLYLLLISMSAHITKQLGMAPGGEFRRAITEAVKFPECLVQLGDRPIHITIQRALTQLSWWQTFRLGWHLITSKDPISKEDVERCKRRDLLEEILSAITGEFPVLSTVFVKERDIFLTYSLEMAAKVTVPSSEGPQPSRVVGVVGIGHVPGIVQHWGTVTRNDIKLLMEVPPPSLASKMVCIGAKISVVGLLLWGCSRIIPMPKSLPNLSDIKTSLQNFIQ